MDSSHITANHPGAQHRVYGDCRPHFGCGLHYRSKRRAQVALTESERDNLEAPVAQI